MLSDRRGQERLRLLSPPAARSSASFTRKRAPGSIASANWSHPDADSVRGVVSAGQNPHKMWRLTDDPLTGAGLRPMQNLLDVDGIDEPYNAPRQILPPVKVPRRIVTVGHLPRSSSGKLQKEALVKLFA